jgi:hypothetical protein
VKLFLYIVLVINFLFFLVWLQFLLHEAVNYPYIESELPYLYFFVMFLVLQSFFLTFTIFIVKLFFPYILMNFWFTHSELPIYIVF